jgi:type IV pilus assembly protein PilB
MARQQKKLGEILVELGALKAADVDKALAHAKTKNLRIGDALIDLNLVPENVVYKALATQHGLEYVDLDKVTPPANATTIIPADQMRKHMIIPLAVEGNRVRVAIHDPLNLEALEVLRFRLNKDIRPVLAPKSKIVALVEAATGSSSVGGSVDKTMDKTIDRMRTSMDKSVDKSLDKSVDKSARSIDKSVDVSSMGEDNAADPTQAPMVKMVHALISEAVRGRASDIHIEPMKDRVRVRYRIDGECVERDRIPLRMRGPLISRLKIMAGIDIAEKRLPQDGRIKMIIDKVAIDFRVSSLPAYHGESMVLRILRPDSVRIGIQNLGFEEEDYKAFTKIIRRPNGIFLVTGPTGSGKTTTLYGALNELNRPDRKIITAEDPVEYNFVGINQCQVREAIGLKFAMILRAMLRQAPNIILVGEIRDIEVAEVAIQAALTGHLVFSTLHTNDAPGAITRLIDMGVKPFLVASSIQAVMGQRLVRILCPKCKAPDPSPDAKWMRLAGITEKDMAGRNVCKPVGCENCSGIGFRGRRGIFEMMVMNNAIRELAFNRAPSNKIRQAAIQSGMKTLLQDGRLKVLAGITTAEEIVKVAQVEGLVGDQPQQ